MPTLPVGGNEGGRSHVWVEIVMNAALPDEHAKPDTPGESKMIEPVFGHLKESRDYRRFSRQGINAVRSE